MSLTSDMAGEKDFTLSADAVQCAAILEKQCAPAGISLSRAQLLQFARYYDLLTGTNKVMNLTALTSPQDVAVKHFIDSLLCYDAALMKGKTLIDVGTGAGFPGIPLKIYEPSMQVVLLDSLAKRLKFLQDAATGLGDTLPNTVRKMTGAVADRFMIAERGYLKEGYYADLTVFDEEKVRNGIPDQEKAFGIEKVFVNGQLVLNDDKLDEKALKTTGRAIPVL